MDIALVLIDAGADPSLEDAVSAVAACCGCRQLSTDSSVCTDFGAIAEREDHPGPALQRRSQKSFCKCRKCKSKCGLVNLLGVAVTGHTRCTYRYAHANKYNVM